MNIPTNADCIFDQLTGLLDRLTDDQYTAATDIFSGASIGKHYRHIIEFFQCVYLANETETICYDNRLRDTRMENDRIFAKKSLKDLKSELGEVDNEKFLTLIGALGIDDQLSGSYMLTSLLRELHYAIEHAIHHMAIIRMGVKQAFPEVYISVDFGVAPSTLRYHQSAKSG